MGSDPFFVMGYYSLNPSSAYKYVVMINLMVSCTAVPAPVCWGPPTSSGGVITVHWNYTHTGGMDLTRVVIAATRGVETAHLNVPNGNLTDLSQMTLDVTTFTAGFEYTFTVTAYNEMGPGTAVCDRVTHLIGRITGFFFLC